METPEKRKPIGTSIYNFLFGWGPMILFCCLFLLVVFVVVYLPAQGNLPGSSEKAFFVSSEFATENANENKNPYAETLLVDFIIGNRFANYTGSLSSQGISVSVESGREVALPAVKTLNGYVFKGWSSGGVGKVEIGAEEKTASFERGDEGQWHMTLYAVYADKDGNLYCSCGAYKEAAPATTSVAVG